jgi:hypothetical protein
MYSRIQRGECIPGICVDSLSYRRSDSSFRALILRLVSKHRVKDKPKKFFHSVAHTSQDNFLEKTKGDASHSASPMHSATCFATQDSMRSTCANRVSTSYIPVRSEAGSRERCNSADMHVVLLMCLGLVPSFGQKTQSYPFHRTYAPTIMRSPSCIPLRDGPYSPPTRGNDRGGMTHGLEATAGVYYRLR